MREHGIGDAIGKSWETRDSAYRDEHGRDTRHGLGMFSNKVPQGVVWPERGVCHHWEIGLLIDNGMEQHGQGAPSPDVDSRAGMLDRTCVLGAAALVTAAACTEGATRRNL